MKGRNMARHDRSQHRNKPLFGAEPTRHRRSPGLANGAPARPSGQALAVQLTDRLAEKHRNYERAALRLELRGETDAADVLRRAAARLRLIRNNGRDQEDIA